MTITIYGSYDSLTRNGTMRIVYRNDSTGTIRQARTITAITEDSIIFHAPSGDSIHNNVARDYVPDPGGQVFSIPAGDSAVIAQYFTVDTAWDVSKCMIVTWLQDDNMTADSVKPIYQGSKKLISALEPYAICEESPMKIDRQCRVSPNPCRNGTRFGFILNAGQHYTIGIFDIQGRKIKEIAGSSRATENYVYWDCRDDNHESVRSGVYFYRIASDPMSPAPCGKIIVR